MDEILDKLVSFHTTTDDAQSVHEAMDYIAEFLAERGMHIERFELNGHESLVATVGQGVKRPKVMLGAHLDVVPAADEQFAVRRESGKLYGRGALDMKFAIAAYMQIVDELQGNLAGYDFGIMVTSDEENGGRDGTPKLLEEGYIPEVCVLPDGGDDWQIQLHSKGFLYLILRSRGTPAHASQPWSGRDAISPLIDTVQEIQTLFPEEGPETNTYNLGKMVGGAAINQVADYAEAAVDIRATSNDERERVLSEVQAICEKQGIELEVQIKGGATEFSLDNPYIKPFAQAITEVTGVEVTGSRTLGSNDTRFFMEHGVPCISLYPSGGGHHGPNEYIEEQAFHQFKEVTKRYLNRVTRIGAAD